MGIIFSKILLSFLLILPLCGLYSQQYHKEFSPKNYPIPFWGLNSNKIDLKNHSQNIINNINHSISNNTVKIDSILTYGANGSSSKITYTYSGSGKIITYTIFHLQNSTWVKGEQITNAYDSLVNLISTLHELWTGYNWENFIFEEFRYDSSGNCIFNSSKEWIYNDWVNIFRISSFYNQNNNLVTSIEEKWIANSWINASKIVRSYFPNGLRFVDTFEVWENNKWEYDILTTFEYEDKWILFSIINKKWIDNSWNNYVRTTFTYSLIKPQTIGLIEAWFDNQWIYYDRYSYSYNANNYFTHGVYDYWINDQWIPGDGNIHVNNPDGFDLHFYTHELIVYYAKPTKVEEDNFYIQDYELSQNYPNPFNQTTTINYQLKEDGLVMLKLYNILGAEVMSLDKEEKTKGRYTYDFNGSDLPSGVYIYQLRVNDFVSSRKMMLIK